MLRRIRQQDYRVSTALLGSLRGFTAETLRKRRPPSTTVGKAVASLNSARASQRNSSPVTSSHSPLQSSPSAPSSSRVIHAYKRVPHLSSPFYFTLMLMSLLSSISPTYLNCERVNFHDLIKANKKNFVWRAHRSQRRCQ